MSGGSSKTPELKKCPDSEVYHIRRKVPDTLIINKVKIHLRLVSTRGILLARI